MGRLPSLVLVCALLSSAFLASCGWRDAPDTDGMRVAVNFSDRHRCSRISPEVTVFNPPRGTDYYEVRVSVIGTSPERFLGGGRWNYGELNSDNASVIPEGGLGISYRSPCPAPGDSQKKFRYTVYAMSRLSTKPLAISDYILTLE